MVCLLIAWWIFPWQTVSHNQMVYMMVSPDQWMFFLFRNKRWGCFFKSLSLRRSPVQRRMLYWLAWRAAVEWARATQTWTQSSSWIKANIFSEIPWESPNRSTMRSNWLVVWNSFYFIHILGMIILPIDFHIFQRGRLKPPISQMFLVFFFQFPIQVLEIAQFLDVLDPINWTLAELAM